MTACAYAPDDSKWQTKKTGTANGSFWVVLTRPTTGDICAPTLSVCQPNQQPEGHTPMYDCKQCYAYIDPK